MLKWTCYAALTLLGAGVWVAPAIADEPDWEALPYTPHADYQAVDADGVGTYPLSSEIKMRGIILNRPEDLLDPAAGADAFMGGAWRVALQAVDDDFGGTTLWMGQNIGKLNGTHPVGSYTDLEWQAELQRLGHDAASGRAFHPGDLVEVRAKAPGLFDSGRTDVSEAYSKDADADFDLVLIYAGEGLPTPTYVELSDLKRSIPGPAFDTFRFDSTRQSGAEVFQGSVIEIWDVAFISTTNWGPDGELLITNGTLTLPVKLGRSADFSAHPAPAGSFRIVGIFDQEDTNGGDGYKAGYRLYVTGYDGTEFYASGQDLAPADFDRDGDVDMIDFAHLQRCLTSAELEVAPECGDSDLNKDRLVNEEDMWAYQDCVSGAQIRANPECLSHPE